MPTKVKRVQVLLKEQVLTHIETISNDLGISLSKVVSILTEEALAHRGMFDPVGEARKAVIPGRGIPTEHLTDIQREVAATERGWTPNNPNSIESFTPEWGSASEVSLTEDRSKNPGLNVTTANKAGTSQVEISQDDLVLLEKLKKLKALEDAGII